MTWFTRSPKPRRAMKPRIGKRSLAVLIGSILGLLGVMTAAAVMLPPRIAADNIAVPVATTQSVVADTAEPQAAPSQKFTARAVPKSTKSAETNKSTETRTVPKPTKTAKKKVVPPPHIIGTRYACTTLNIRAAAGLKSLIVDKVPPRTKLKIMNRTDGKFRMIRFEKKNRWAYRPCLWKKPPPKVKPPAVKKDVVKKAEPAPKKSSAPSTPKGVWDKLANCESSGDWHINTGNGFYGGLQFTKGTWLAYGGGKYASRADLATRSEQIAIATKVRNARGGYGDWPACSRKLGLPQ